MYHLSGFFAAVGNVANTKIQAISDDILPLSGTDFLPSRTYDLIQAYVGSATLSRARLNSGTIRQVNPTYIRPINVGTLPGNNANVMRMTDNPFFVQAHEALSLEATSGVAMTENLYALLWLQTQYVPAPGGRTYNMRITSTTAAVANVWSTIPYAFETGLPAGRWAVVGGELQSANGVAFRLIFDGQTERPGVLMLNTIGQRLLWETYYGGLGKWGEFFTYSLPRLQVLCNAADAAFEGYIEVVPMMGGMVP